MRSALRWKYSSSLMSVVGQGLGLAQLLVLFWGTGASQETDLYFLLSAWAQVPYQLILAGVLYPIWLRGSGASAKLAKWSALLTAPISAVAPVLGAITWNAVGRSTPANKAVVGAFAIQGAVAALYWVGAFWESAKGDALFVSGSGVLPNSLGLLLGAAAIVGGLDRVLLMALGQTLGFAAAFFLLARLRGNAWREALAWRPGVTDGSPSRAYRSFALQAFVSYGAILALQSVGASLPPTILSLVGTVQKVQTGLTGVVVNASLPRLVHSNSSSGMHVRIFMTRLLAAATTLGAIGYAVALAISPSRAWLVAALASLFAVSAVNAGSKRVAARFLSPNWAFVTVTVSALVPLVAVLNISAMSVEWFIAAYLVLELVPGAALSVALRWRTVAIMTLTACAFAMVAVHASIPR